jgi:hypothetical protein
VSARVVSSAYLCEGVNAHEIRLAAITRCPNGVPRLELDCSGVLLRRNPAPVGFGCHRPVDDPPRPSHRVRLGFSQRVNAERELDTWEVLG